MRFENVACCDDCWWGDQGNGEFTGQGMSREGMRMPYRMRNEVRPLEVCHFCGYETFSGIYIRTDVDEIVAAKPQTREVLA
jgi:hypothetical protein